MSLRLSALALCAVSATTAPVWADPIGLYFGFGASYATGETSTEFDFPRLNTRSAIFSDDYDLDGVSVTGRVGYMTEFGNFIFGGEFNFSGTTIGSSQTARTTTLISGSRDSFTQEIVDIDDLMELRAIFGTQITDTITLLGSLGIAQGDASVPRLGGLFQLGSVQVPTTIEEITGVSVGVGAMFDISDDAAFTLNYTFTDFESFDVSTGLRNDLATQAPLQTRTEYDMSIGRVEAGFIFRF